MNEYKTMFNLLPSFPSKAVKFQSNILTLKLGCKVMLQLNLNHELKKCSFGTFTKVTDDNNRLLVKFPNVGVVSIQV